MSNLRLDNGLTDVTIREVPEMELRAYLALLKSDTKRIERELERRVKFNQEVNGVNYHELQPIKSTATVKSPRELKTQQDKQAKVKQLLDIIERGIKAGTLTQKMAEELLKGD
jgi:hypothetical protein